MAVAAAAVAIADSSECFDFVLSQKKALQAAAPFFLDISSQFVFVVDTWRNPAVEAQAIDRAHRMGQTKSVNAYRMVCSETVEQKIIELQQSKRDLADAIISQEKSLIGDLTAEDIEKLLA